MNRLNEMVLLSTQNKCLNGWVRKYIHFYAHKISLPGSIPATSSKNLGSVGRENFSYKNFLQILDWKRSKNRLLISQKASKKFE